ncbi:MAG TPA: hypothetical protein VK164_12175 [Flavobacterium sp.]|uniref:hypothetical protein n=1 Tax=Flavobacterium sp. TaxID=239 RepID=UPI002B4ACB55|nr:hypothetical protein [Flavobacterium sp.]HLO74687.1 hypothetical protein [Flavobacterium sp.]
MESMLVEQLVEKYFQGETTIAEEKQLKAYFSSSDVAPHLVKYQSLFGYFETQKATQFEQKLPLQPRKQSTVKWIGIAASFVILFGLATFFLYPTEPNKEDLGTFDNPEEAYVETQKALLMVSEQVNFGMESVSHLKEYEKTKKTIFK